MRKKKEKKKDVLDKLHEESKQRPELSEEEVESSVKKVLGNLKGTRRRRGK
jgi:hypothetical protein